MLCWHLHTFSTWNSRYEGPTGVARQPVSLQPHTGSHALRQVLDPGREMKGSQPLNMWLSIVPIFDIELNLQHEWEAPLFSGGRAMPFHFHSIYVTLPPVTQHAFPRVVHPGTALGATDTAGNQSSRPRGRPCWPGQSSQSTQELGPKSVRM